MIDKNFVINNEFYEQEKDLIPYLFGDEPYELVSRVDMYDLLVRGGYFKSKGDARKNWTRTGRDIPNGYTEYRDIGKFHNQLFIFNPINTNEIN
jgi:hypothetical protein